MIAVSIPLRTSGSAPSFAALDIWTSSTPLRWIRKISSVRRRRRAIPTYVPATRVALIPNEPHSHGLPAAAAPATVSDPAFDRPRTSPSPARSVKSTDTSWATTDVSRARGSTCTVTLNRVVPGATSRRCQDWAPPVRGGETGAVSLTYARAAGSVSFSQTWRAAVRPSFVTFTSNVRTSPGSTKLSAHSRVTRTFGARTSTGALIATDRRPAASEKSAVIGRSIDAPSSRRVRVVAVRKNQVAPCGTVVARNPTVGPVTKTGPGPEAFANARSGSRVAFTHTSVASSVPALIRLIAYRTESPLATWARSRVTRAVTAAGVHPQRR